MLTQVIVLAVLQGVTLILPVGNATHLALLSHVLGWAEPPTLLNMAIRVGVVLAIAAYCWRDLWDMASGIVRAAKGKRDAGARLALQILVAAVLTLGLGFAGAQYLPPEWRSQLVMAWATIGYGLLLLFFDRMSMTVKRLEHAGFGDTFGISIVQILALIPGTSSVGAAITMARFLGYERTAAVRLAMLLSIPVLIAAVGADAFQLTRDGGLAVTDSDWLAGGISFVAALLTLATLVGYVRRGTLTPVLVYRILVGVAAVGMAYGWLPI